MAQKAIMMIFVILAHMHTFAVKGLFSITMSKRGRRSQHRKEKDDSTLFVSIRGQKLPDYITGQHLKQHFEQFEHVIVSSNVQREKDTMKSKGYAFINFTSSAAASQAMGRYFVASFLSRLERLCEKVQRRVQHAHQIQTQNLFQIPIQIPPTQPCMWVCLIPNFLIT